MRGRRSVDGCMVHLIHQHVSVRSLVRGEEGTTEEMAAKTGESGLEPMVRGFCPVEDCR
jgi:hypothetical protein